jgi:hypothetical protein
MKAKETFTTSLQILAAFLLAKGIKMERIEVIPAKRYFPDSCFHFPKDEAENLLNNGNRMVNFTDLKIEYDLLAIEAAKAEEEFRKNQEGRS